MKVICARKDLFEGVQTAARAVSPRTSLPILGHLLISAKEDKLHIVSTDLEIGLECWVEANVQEEGAMTVPARMLNEILTVLPETDVVLSVDESHTVSLKCANSSYTILGLSPEEYPALPQVEKEVSFTVDYDMLRDGIRKSLFAVSEDESRAVLTGVLMQVTESDLKLVATDTRRLCMWECPLTDGQGMMNAVVPGRAMHELLRILPEGDGSVDVGISSGQIVFKIDDTVLISRLIEGQYWNFEKIIASDYAKKLIVPTQQLLQSLKRVAIVARENLNRVAIETEDNRLIISAESGTVGTAREEVDVVKTGGDVKMAFNVRYLIDVLSVIETEAVEIELGGEISQTAVRGQAQDNYIYVVMPIRLG